MTIIPRVLGLVALAGGLVLTTPAGAQSAASAYTTGYRYDLAHRLTGTISPGASGASGPFLAVRNTYDAEGKLIEIETGSLSAWQPDTNASGQPLAPASWTGFAVYKTETISYDSMNRKIKDVIASGSTPYQVTQYSYDSGGRLECTAVRMNPAVFSSLPASACVLSTEGSFGPDRITRDTYDAGDRLLAVQKAYGVTTANGFPATLQQNYATYSYTDDDKQASVTDANGNLATRTYDGFDRLSQWTFPSKTAAGRVDPTDYEAYGYDADDNRTSLRKRDGSTIKYTYDGLNRLTIEDVPTGSDVYYGYDAESHQLYARFGSTTGAGITNTYDGFGDLLSTSSNQSGVAETISHVYDADGNRIQVTHPDGTYFVYGYDGLDRLKTIQQNGTMAIVSATYDANMGTVATLVRGAVTTTYGYDGIFRLTSTTNDLAGTANDETTTLSYNSANQIISETHSNDAYAYSNYVDLNYSYGRNGLNQYTAVGATAYGYDANGNLTSDGSSTYTYDSENRLLSATGLANATLTYDPLGRLYQTTGATGTTRFLYDGDELVEEYNTSGTVLRRYVHGNDEDDPLIWYEGSGLTDRRSLQDDHQGSIISFADASGNLLHIDSYDDYGVPNGVTADLSGGRFRFTGQAWLPDLGMYYYKARIYSPRLGRFMQTDPIGYTDQNNLYAYTSNDPVNATDPTGDIQDRGDCTGSLTCTGTASPGTCLGNCGSGGNPWETAEAHSIYGKLEKSGDAYGVVGMAFGEKKPGMLVEDARDDLLKILEVKYGGKVTFSRQNWWVKASPKQEEEAMSEYRQIRTDLAKGYVSAAKKDKFMQPGRLNSYQIYELHKTIFSQHGLGMRAYGGSQFTGTALEGTLSAMVWCPRCLVQ